MSFNLITALNAKIATIYSMGLTNLRANYTTVASHVRMNKMTTKDNHTDTSECKEASTDDYCDIC